MLISAPILSSGGRAVLGCCGLVLAGVSLFLVPQRAQAAELVIQAFDRPFRAVVHMLPEYKNWGATHVLVSPPQKSADVAAWWGRYQPLDYETIAGPLGSEDDLRALGEAAAKADVGLLADTVLNHMADPQFAPGLSYSQFDAGDFHFAQEQRCIYDYGNRLQATTHWLCDRRSSLPDLRTEDAKVRNVHLRYLQKLVGLGVTGFRFDAAVNIETEYFDFMTAQIRSWTAFSAPSVRATSPQRSLFMFAEVVGTSLDEVRLYTGYFPVTDFFLLNRMIHAFGPAGQLQQLTWDRLGGEALPESRAGQAPAGYQGPVAFVRTHDALDNDDFFRFYAATDEDLAFAYMIGRGGETPVLLLDRDLDRPAVQTALDYRRYFDGQIPRAEFGGFSCSSCDQPHLLLWHNGQDPKPDEGKSGLVLINKSTAWVDLPELHLKLSQRLSEHARVCYEDRRYHFEACFEGQSGQDELAIVAWAGQDRSTCAPSEVSCDVIPRIGPRTALLLTQTP